MRAILRTSANIQLGEPAIDVTKLITAEERAEQPGAETKGDIVVTGPLRKSLQRLAFNVFFAAVAEHGRQRNPAEVDELTARLGQLKPSTTRTERGRIYAKMLEGSFGHDWRRTTEFLYGHGGFLMEGTSKTIDSSDPHQRQNLLEVLGELRARMSDRSDPVRTLLCQGIPMPDGPPLLPVALFRRASASAIQCDECVIRPEVRDFFDAAAHACDESVR